MIVLFDINVVLDVLLRREPHAAPAVRLFSAVEQGDLSGILAASTLPTIYYVATKTVGAARARAHLRSLLKLFTVAPVNRAILEDALTLPFSDYEDAILHEAARHAGAAGVVTRNLKDFVRATLRVYSPDELVQALRTGNAE